MRHRKMEGRSRCRRFRAVAVVGKNRRDRFGGSIRPRLAQARLNDFGTSPRSLSRFSLVASKTRGASLQNQRGSDAHFSFGQPILEG